jgi:hypothetical protein
MFVVLILIIQSFTSIESSNNGDHLILLNDKLQHHIINDDTPMTNSTSFFKIFLSNQFDKNFMIRNLDSTGFFQIKTFINHIFFNTSNIPKSVFILSNTHSLDLFDVFLKKINVPVFSLDIEKISNFHFKEVCVKY